MNLIRRTFNIVRNLLAIIGLISLAAGGFAAVFVIGSYDLPPRLLAEKALKKYGLGQTVFAEWVKQDPVRPVGLILPDLNSRVWRGHGARSDRALSPLTYDQKGRPLSVPHTMGSGGQAGSHGVREVRVATSTELLNALRIAEAGDCILISPGVYSIRGHNVELTRAGTPAQPIMVTAAKFGDVVLEMDTLEGFWLNGPYWVFENLDIKGMLGNDDYHEHAFHVVGGAQGFVLRNCRIHEFNSAIKGNGSKNKDGEVIYPDNVLIENCTFFNSRIRDTSNPVNAIDVVGASGWIIRGNLIADFAKAQGDQISYAAFLKGNGKGGVFENNLVVGEYNTTGGVRVGLSLGGGGTGTQFFRDGDEAAEHTGGIVRNNIVMYFSDVGLYLNKARNTRVLNNTLYRTLGIDIRFYASSALIQNNLLTGNIEERDGGSSDAKNNLMGSVAEFSKWFENPERGDFRLKNGKKIVNNGILTEDALDDFYENKRDLVPDIGAIEYDRNNPKNCLPVLGE